MLTQRVLDDFSNSELSARSRDEFISKQIAEARRMQERWQVFSTPELLFGALLLAIASGAVIGAVWGFSLLF